MFVIFDLDGTLADIEHRVHLVRGKKKNFNAFYAACGDDLPKQAIIGALLAHVQAGHVVEIWSGRSDQVEEETRQWLERYGIDPALLTRMRAADDYTRDDKLKEAWLLSLNGKGLPDLIYDDRTRVVDMWRSHGLTVAQVDRWEEG